MVNTYYVECMNGVILNTYSNSIISSSISTKHGNARTY